MMKFERCIIFSLLSASLHTMPTAMAQSSQSSPSSEHIGTLYANMPPAARPYASYRKPYQEWYVQPDTLKYDGAARSETDGDASTLQSIVIGFLGPMDTDNPDSAYGIAMLHGAQMAIDEANSRGGYHGKPFALKVHNDLALWGASSMAIVDMRFKDQAWAMLGSVDSSSTHIALRAALKLELPIMDTATNDPTVTQTLVPWLVHNFPDDRQQGYALADYIFLQRHLKRVAILQVNNRYGRTGTQIFAETARRFGRPPIVEAWYAPGATDFTTQLRMIQASGADGVVIWGNALKAGLVLKQMRSLGMQQQAFGSSRTCYTQAIEVAGAAAEGLTVVSVLDTTRNDRIWTSFRQRFIQRFGTEPDAYAAYAYDGATMLIDAISHAGLNRGRIMDALRSYGMKTFTGVSGTAHFDYTLNNIAPVTFAQVRSGKYIYWQEQRTDWKLKAASDEK